MTILFGFLLLLLVAPIAVYLYNNYQYANTQASFRKIYLENKENKLPSFKTIDLEGHQYTHDGIAMPFMDAKVFKPYHDERAAIFVTGGTNQKNKVYLYENGKFREIAKELGLEGRDETKYSFAFVDIDGDKVPEVILGYQTGIYAYKFDRSTQRYTQETKISDVPDAALPHDISFADTRNSGYNDLFISTFVDRKHFTSATYHNLTNKRPNLFLVNNGDGTFTDKTKEAGLGILENTYLSAFIDFNNNGLQDLVVAYNTNICAIYENKGDGTFKEHKLPIDYGFWMGLSVEKIKTEDSKYHILLSNVGKSFPEFLLKGDLYKNESFQGSYALLEQVKDFEFKDVTKEKNLFSNVFGWGLKLVDLNNNGKKDAILTENYFVFPGGIHKKFPSKGKVFMQNTDGSFAMMQEELKLLNPNFGYRVDNYDFTGNGFQDIIIGNIDGPLKVYLNEGVRK